MPVAGRPLVHRIVAWVSAHGIRDLVLNLHHRPETITREVGDGSALGVRVRYSWEQPILGSAGGPRHALPLLDADPFVIVNGDTLTDLDLHAMWAAHVASGARVTLALIENPKPEHYGGVVLDPAHRVVRFTRAGAEPRTFHFIGVQIVSASVFAPLADPAFAETVNALYPRLIADSPGCIRGYVSDVSFSDVGTPRDYLETTLAIARREAVAGPLSGRRTRIAPSAALSDCVLWDDVVVGAGCRLARCIVADGVCLADGSTCENCAIVNDADARPVATPIS